MPNQKLFKNYFSIIFVKGINLIFPILILPYLTKVFQPDDLGNYYFLQALTAYFVILIDYGFEFYAPKVIAPKQNDNKFISDFISSAFCLKFLITLASSFLFIFIFFLTSLGEKNALLYFSFLFILLANAINPLWYFLGMEKIRILSTATAISRLLLFFLIFLLVNKQSQLFFLPLFEGAISLITNSLVLLFVLRKEKRFWVPPTLAKIKLIAKDSFLLFYSRISISLYTVSNPFILGYFASPTQVGIFTAALKIVELIQSLIHPFNQILYPYITKLREESPDVANKFALKALITLFILFFTICSGTSFYADYFLPLLLGNKFHDSILVFKKLIFAVVFIAISGVIGFMILLPAGHKKIFSYIISVCAVLSIISSIILVPIWHEEATTWIFVSTEACIAILMVIAALRLKLIKLSFKSIPYRIKK